MKFLCSFFIVALSLTAYAAPNEEIILEDLQWVDSGYLERQRSLVDEITRGEFGTPLRANKSDLKVLQRIIDNELINQTETQKLQALGVAFGDVFVNELGLEWKVYLDSVGKSRATCIKDTQHCLFPITMISKRARLGAKPNVSELYNKGISYLEDHIPKQPYSGSKY